MEKTLTIILTVILAICTSNYCAEAKPNTYTSPDGRYSVQVAVHEGDDPTFSIKDNQSGKVDRTVELTLPLLLFRWGKDSTTFVSVEHVAGGTLERIVFNLDGMWVSHVIESPSKEMHECNFVDAKIGSNTVHMTIKFIMEDKEGLRDGYGQCQFDVNSATGECSDLITVPISAEQFAKMGGGR